MVEEIIKVRIKNQQLVTPAFERAGELVGWMGAMQAQDYAMVKWAVGLRLKQGSLATVNEALQRGEIVRMHVMRPTWHLVAGEDIRWMLKLSGLRVKKCIDLWSKGKGIDIPEGLYTRCNDLFGKVLSGRRCMTKERIEEELKRAGIPVDAERVRRYLLRSEVEGILCSGADEGGKPTYALLDEWVAPAPDLSREEALAKLALNYFRSHAPATLKDFIWWSGLTISEAKRAVGALGNGLCRECIGGQEFLFHQSCGESGKGDCFHFLPSYDEYLIAYKDRSAALDAVHVPKVHNKWGIFYPVLLYQGKIVGNWTKKQGKERISFTVSFFEQENGVEPRLVESAEKEFLRFCGRY